MFGRLCRFKVLCTMKKLSSHKYLYSLNLTFVSKCKTEEIDEISFCLFTIQTYHCWFCFVCRSLVTIVNIEIMIRVFPMEWTL